VDSFAGVFDGFYYISARESSRKADKFDNVRSIKILHKRALGSALRDLYWNKTPEQKGEIWMDLECKSQFLRFRPHPIKFIPDSDMLFSLYKRKFHPVNPFKFHLRLSAKRILGYFQPNLDDFRTRSGGVHDERAEWTSSWHGVCSKTRDPPRTEVETLWFSTQKQHISFGINLIVWRGSKSKLTPQRDFRAFSRVKVCSPDRKLLCFGYGCRRISHSGTTVPTKSYHHSGPLPMRPNEL